MTNYNGGNWHGWNGGECPLHPNSRIEAIFTNIHGQLMKGERSAGNHTWTCSGETHAFRVIKEHKEPREFWIVGGAAYDSVEGAQEDKRHGEEIIHVREVLS